jgi:hypothetical protein
MGRIIVEDADEIVAVLGPRGPFQVQNPYEVAGVSFEVKG